MNTISLKEVSKRISDQKALTHRTVSIEALAILDDKCGSSKPPLACPVAVLASYGLAIAESVFVMELWHDERQRNNPELWGAPKEDPEEIADKAAAAAAKRTDARKKSSPANGKKGGRPAAMPHADTADLFAATNKDENGRIKLIHFHGEYYQYKKGRWGIINKDQVSTKVADFMRKDDDLRPFATTNYVASVLLHLRTSELCGIPDLERPIWIADKSDARNWVAFNNGLVIDQWDYANTMSAGITPDPKLNRKVSPDFFSSDFVDYPWQPKLIPERFFAYLDRVLPDLDNQAMLQRMFGLMLADTAKYELFFQFYGNGANGKTVALDILCSLVGKHNISFVPLGGLVERFQQWPLAQSKVNICGELPTDVGRGQYHQIEGMFKDCVSGGEIEVEKKNKDKYSARSRARWVLASNSLPTFVDRSEAIWRRLRIIPFSIQIPESERDPDLAATIIRTELPGVAQWALEGLAEVIKMRGIPDSPDGKRLKDAHRLSCDHERLFITEHYEQGEDTDRIKGLDLYNEYRAWISENGYRALGASRFYARIEEVLPGAVYGSIRINQSPAKGFRNVRKKDQWKGDL